MIQSQNKKSASRKMSISIELFLLVVSVLLFLVYWSVRQDTNTCSDVVIIPLNRYPGRYRRAPDWNSDLPKLPSLLA